MAKRQMGKLLAAFFLEMEEAFGVHPDQGCGPADGGKGDGISGQLFVGVEVGELDRHFPVDLSESFGFGGALGTCVSSDQLLFEDGRLIDTVDADLVSAGRHGPDNGSVVEGVEVIVGRKAGTGVLALRSDDVERGVEDDLLHAGGLMPGHEDVFAIEGNTRVGTEATFLEFGEPLFFGGPAIFVENEDADIVALSFVG